jgi:hypothetical protein
MTGWDDLDTRLEEVNLPFVALSRRNVRANARQSGLSSPTPINHHVANISQFRISIFSLTLPLHPPPPSNHLSHDKQGSSRACMWRRWSLLGPESGVLGVVHFLKE